jgi:hypothetical protein
MQVGNVIKDGFGNISIITEIKDDRIRTVSFTHSGSMGGVAKESSFVEESCMCLRMYPTVDPDCEMCEGTGKVLREIKGWDQCVILADSCASYIRSRMMKNFDF